MDSKPLGEAALVDDSIDDGGTYGWLVNHLAKFPGRVTLVTFAAGAVVTFGVLLIDGDLSIASVVSLVATLWALFFAVMIYLLTARDTDKVLDQISDLHEQLATALDAPAQSDAVVANPAALPADSTLAETHRPDVAPVLAEPDRPVARPVPGESEDQPVRVPASGEPDQPVSVAAPTEPRRPAADRRSSTARVPEDYLAAWQQATGLDPATIHTAWTRDPRAATHWVFETDADGRWLVFKRGSHNIGVMNIDRQRPDHRQRDVRWQPGRGDWPQSRERRPKPPPRPRGT